MTEANPVIFYAFDRPASAQHGPSLSPFCVKMETFLRMTKVPYRFQVARASDGPKNKLPFIEFEGQTVSDSGFIVEFLKEKLRLDIDDGLTEEQQAMGHSIRRMVEEATYWTINYRRFVEQPGELPVLAFGNPSFIIRIFFSRLASKVRKGLYAQGMGRHTPQEVHKLAADDLRALSRILGEKMYFFGEKATSTDAAVFGFLSQMLWMMPESPQEKLVKTELRNLEDYCWRMRRAFWQDWENLKQSATA